MQNGSRRTFGNRVKAVVFGAGVAGQASFEGLSQVFDICCFADNDAAKHGTVVCGKPVISPVELKTLDCETILIASQAEEAIRNQLVNELGISKWKIQSAALWALDRDAAAVRTIENSQHCWTLVLERLKKEKAKVIWLLGEARAIREGLAAAGAKDARVRVVDWAFGDFAPAGFGKSELAVLARHPVNNGEWSQVSELAKELPCRMVSLHQVLWPFAQIAHLWQHFTYRAKTLEELLGLYASGREWGMTDRVDALVPLKGLRVLEFGPWEGYQTAALVRAGVAQLDCVEGRAENVLKTSTLCNAMGWDHVRVFTDDFLNADARRYGRYDLVVCHGSYYHSPHPLLLLENLTTLSDRIYIGGFCASETLPSYPYEEMSDEKGTYRTKPYHETINNTAGIASVGHFFEPESLMAFFTRRGFEVTVISDDACTEVAGMFLRFLAVKK